MFPLPSNKIKRRKLPIITGNYHVVLFEEVPILFTGSNSFGGYIVGSSIEEDYSQSKEWYLHVVVTKDEFLGYTQGQITYRQLLDQAEIVYVLEKNVEPQKTIVYEFEWAEVPDEYKPSEDSYFPSYKAKPTLLYEASQLGGIADRNRATPEDANESLGATAKLLRSALGWLNWAFSLDGSVFAKPVTEGSFSIGYEIALNSNLFLNEGDCLRFINAYMSYLLTDYPSEAIGLVQSKYENLKKFNELFELSQSIGIQRTQGDEDLMTAKASLAKSIYQSTSVLFDLAKNVGINYQKYSVSNLTSVGQNSLGILDTEYKEQVRIALAAVNEAAKQPEVKLEEDEYPRTYKIHVYDFNKRTGNGIVDVREVEDDMKEKPDDLEIAEGNDPVARLHVLNYKKKGVTHLYTQSMHDGTYITVTGKAKRKPDKTIEEIVISE